MAQRYSASQADAITAYCRDHRIGGRLPEILRKAAELADRHGRWVTITSQMAADCGYLHDDSMVRALRQLQAKGLARQVAAHVAPGSGAPSRVGEWEVAVIRGAAFGDILNEAETRAQDARERQPRWISQARKSRRKSVAKSRSTIALQPQSAAPLPSTKDGLAAFRRRDTTPSKTTTTPIPVVGVVKGPLLEALANQEGYDPRKGSRRAAQAQQELGAGAATVAAQLGSLLADVRRDPRVTNPVAAFLGRLAASPRDVLRDAKRHQRAVGAPQEGAPQSAHRPAGAAGLVWDYAAKKLLPTGVDPYHEEHLAEFAVKAEAARLAEMSPEARAALEARVAKLVEGVAPAAHKLAARFHRRKLLFEPIFDSFRLKHKLTP